MKKCGLCEEQSLLRRGALMAMNALKLKQTKYLIVQKDGTLKEQKNEEVENKEISIVDEKEIRGEGSDT